MSSSHSPRGTLAVGQNALSEVVEWLRSIPLFTRFVMFLSVATFIADHAIDRSVYDTCLWPLRVLQNREVFRLFTYPFVHADMAHLFFNLVAFVPMGIVTERAVGTIQMGHLVNFFALIAALIEIALSYAVARLGYPVFYNTCSAGLSGVIFSFVVLSTTRFSTTKRHSILGMFTVSKKYYPWALLVLFQIVFPNASLIGHASGILVGYIYVYGLLDFTHVHNRLVNFIESARLLRIVTHREGFIPQPANGLPVPKTLVKGRTSGYLNDGAFAGIRRFFGRLFRPRSQSASVSGGRVLGTLNGGVTQAPNNVQVVVQNEEDNAVMDDSLLSKKARDDAPARDETGAHTA